MDKTILSFVHDDFVRVTANYINKLQIYNGKSIMIVGGAGFLGSWVTELVHYLNKIHHFEIRLTIVDRNAGNYLHNHPHLVNDEFIKFIRCEARNLSEIPKEINFIINAAANPDNRIHASNPLETMLSISEGLSAVLKSANRVNNLIKILHISSSSIYDTNNVTKPIKEHNEGYSTITNLNTAYSEAKRYSEAICNAARIELRLPIFIVRPFTFCGPFQKLNSPWAVNNFINDAIHNRPIRILGDGRSFRSVMYGADMAIWLLIMLAYSDIGKVYNLGNSEEISLLDLAQIVASQISKPLEIITNSALVRVNDNSYLVPDTNNAENDFNLRIITNTHLSIKRTIEWYRNFSEE